MEHLLSKKELARLLNIPFSTVDYYARKGMIPFTWVGKHRRYDRDKVLKCFKNNGNNN